LLAGLQHLQQQAALSSLALKSAQQPQLQRVMVRVVMLLADKHSGRISQALHQRFRAYGLLIGQVDNLSQLGVRATFTALPGGQRRQAGLTAAYRQYQAQRETG
jgi:hypothetical protein